MIKTAATITALLIATVTASLGAFGAQANDTLDPNDRPAVVTVGTLDADTLDAVAATFAR